MRLRILRPPLVQKRIKSLGLGAQKPGLNVLGAEDAAGTQWPRRSVD
jgi:hypothetical protein